jgi:invasion protein IalB
MMRKVCFAAAFMCVLISASAVAAEVIRLHMPGARTPVAPVAAASAWTTTCVSAARTDAPDCRAEQRSVLQNGQLLAGVTVTVPHDTRKPTLLVQAPFGISVRSGIGLQLDARPPVRLDVQTCDQGGCYAATVMSDDFFKTMLASKKLTVIVQALNQRQVAATLSLQGFAVALQRIR